MTHFLIDANLPYYIGIWHNRNYVYVQDIDPAWSDTEIWHYALTHNFVIVTKDADFSDRVLLSESPPRVVHIRVGNLRLKEFRNTIINLWPRVEDLIEEAQLVQVFCDRVEAIL